MERERASTLAAATEARFKATENIMVIVLVGGCSEGPGGFRSGQQTNCDTLAAVVFWREPRKDFLVLDVFSQGLLY